jgi:hypothetical protein
MSKNSSGTQRNLEKPGKICAVTSFKIYTLQIKSRRKIWAWNVARMKEMRNKIF